MISATKKLQQAHDKMDSLLIKLDRSCALQYLWPEVFDNGSAKSQWAGRAHWRDGLMPKPEHFDHILTVTNGLEEKRQFTYDEVPRILGGGFLIE